MNTKQSRDADGSSRAPRAHCCCRQRMQCHCGDKIRFLPRRLCSPCIWYICVFDCRKMYCTFQVQLLRRRMLAQRAARCSYSSSGTKSRDSIYSTTLNCFHERAMPRENRRILPIVQKSNNLCARFACAIGASSSVFHMPCAVAAQANQNDAHAIRRSQGWRTLAHLASALPVLFLLGRLCS